MKTSPETQALNQLVLIFDELTGYRHDTWTLEQILAWFDGWFDGWLAGAQQRKDKI